MKQIKILYNDVSVGFFMIDEISRIMGCGFHIEDNNIIDKIKLDYPLGTQIELTDNYFRINK